MWKQKPTVISFVDVPVELHLQSLLSSTHHLTCQSSHRLCNTNHAMIIRGTAQHNCKMILTPLGSSVMASGRIHRYISECGTQKQFWTWDSCDLISSPYDLVATLIPSHKQVHVQN